MSLMKLFSYYNCFKEFKNAKSIIGKDQLFVDKFINFRFLMVSVETLMYFCYQEKYHHLVAE